MEKSFSLWIYPNSKTPEFQTVIDYFSDNYTDKTQYLPRPNWVKFDAHATLVSDGVIPPMTTKEQLIQAVDKGLKKWRQYYSGTTHLEIKRDKIETHPKKYWQCVFATLKTESSLVDLHRFIVHALHELVPHNKLSLEYRGESYHPHLSLIYAELEEGKDQGQLNWATETKIPALGDRTPESGLPGSFTCDEILLVETGAAVKEWKQKILHRFLFEEGVPSVLEMGMSRGYRADRQKARARCEKLMVQAY